MSPMQWKVGLIAAGLIAFALAIGMREAAGVRSIAGAALFEPLTAQRAKPLGPEAYGLVANPGSCRRSSGWPFFAGRC